MTENFASRLESRARLVPAAPALVWDGGALTWDELERRAGGFAQSLARRGIQPGERIAVSLPNRWSFVVALWGGFKCGATVVPLNPLLTPDERDRILAHLRPKLVVDTVDRHLCHQPEIPTRNRKRLRPNPVAPWELRIGDLRVFYAVEVQAKCRVGSQDDEAATDGRVFVLAVGVKRGNRLWVGNEECEL